MKYKRLKMSKPIPVMLDQPLLERIDNLSEKMGEAKSTVMRIAMRLGLAGLEKTLREAPERLSQDALRSAAYPEHKASGLLLNETRKTLNSSKGISDKTRKEIEDAALRDLNAAFPPKESK
jgi:DNA-binding MurR/RpiR family transcriptional regulator